MKPRKKKTDNRLLDVRVVLFPDDSDLVAFLHEDAKRNDRTLQGQARYMLRKLMEMENDGR